MKRNFTLTLLVLVVTLLTNLSLKAQTTTLQIDITTAGTLETLLGSNKNTVENLTLAGNINGTDINTLRDIIANQKLTSLDIANVTILGGTTYNDKYNNSWPTVENEITDNMFHQLPKLTSIVLPKKITKIGARAFNLCHGLTSIDIPSKVTEIGSSAFAQCSTLTKVIIPASVTTIGASAFYYSQAISEIHCLGSTPATLGSGNVFSGVDQTVCTLYVPYGATGKYTAKAIWLNFTNMVEENPVKPETVTKTLTVSPAGSLAGLLSSNDMSDVTDIILSGDLNGTDIKTLRAMENLFVLDIQNSRIVAGGDAYYNYAGADQYTSNDIIPAYAFFGLRKLTSVLLPATITKIDNSAFYECSSLASIDLPGNVNTIEEYAFCRCYTLDFPVIGSNVTTIGNYAFASNYKMETANIPNTVSTLGSAAFQGNTKLTTVTMGSGLTTLNSSTFSGCIALKNITIGANITTLGDNTFNGCTALESIIIPENVTNIGNATFRGCTALKTASMGSKVTTVPAGAFFDCTSLQSVYCKTLIPPSITANSFYNVPVSTCTLYVPTISISTYGTTAYWKDFLNIVDITTGISSDSTSDLYVSSTADGILITTEEPALVSIYDISGKTVYQELQITEPTNISLAKGIYFVKTGKQTVKVIVK